MVVGWLISVGLEMDVRRRIDPLGPAEMGFGGGDHQDGVMWVWMKRGEGYEPERVVLHVTSWVALSPDPASLCAISFHVLLLLELKQYTEKTTRTPTHQLKELSIDPVSAKRPAHEASSTNR